jgi:hypothetical protein
MAKSIGIVPGMIVFLIITLLVGSCTVDPYEDVQSNERSIEKFLIDGQIGVPIIKSRNQTETEAVIYVKKGAVDLSQVTPEIRTSYNAVVSPPSGETVSFQNPDSSAVFTVTAESGKSQKWKVTIKEYDYDMEGIWKVVKIEYTYHTAPSEPWGWTGTKEFQWYMTGAKFANDDSFEFKLEGVTADGKIVGTFIHDLGDDGEAATFIYDAADPHYDMNYKFSKLPIENATWIRDFSSNTIKFNAGLDNETQSLPIELNDAHNMLTLPFDPGPADFPGGDDWNRGEIQYSTKFWYVLQKVE